MRVRQVESLESRTLLAADFLSPSLETAAPTDIATGPLLQDVHEITGVTVAHERYGLTGEGQTVVVIDSGVAYDHFALGGGFGESYRVVGGWDFTEENDDDPYDDGPAGFHGTHVAGIIGGSGADHLGVAPSVDLVALRVFNDQGEGYFRWVESALQWVHRQRDEFANPITTVNLSLGAQWHDDAVPSWAILEDEFAQLQQDGIFVAVAAGNSFQDDSTIGLSYPAVSPYVVPVASVGDDGSLSSFSQRHSRVIAAPGENVVSTAPDHLFDFNGIADDFAPASGTSMASPYLAGAGVLVRQAMQLASYDQITPSSIYDTLKDTADSVYDSETEQSYSRLNMTAAIESILSEDDVGSTLQTAHAIGEVSSFDTITGSIERIDDVDWFTFVAGQNGRAILSADSTGTSISVDTGDRGMDFTVNKGQTYSIAIAGDQHNVGEYSLAVELQPDGTDLGLIDNKTISVSLDGDAEIWYGITAMNNAQLSVQTDIAADIELYSLDGQLLTSGSPDALRQRIDWQAKVGERFRLRMSTVDAISTELKIANVVSLNSQQFVVNGSSGHDEMLVSLGSNHVWISVNGIVYGAARSAVRDVHILGGEGNDTLRIKRQ